jgi:DNA sulfur modification protein DndC
MAFSPYDLNEQTILAIQREYLASERPWVLGYSGGKDSSALLKLVFLALMHLEQRPKKVTVIYCDTGVEIPIVRSLAISTLVDLKYEADRHGIPLDSMCVSPRLEDRFFVKVIGRGYPSPTNKFRWCTDKLRIEPVQRALSSLGEGHSLVLLGIRRGESISRDRTILRHETASEYFFRHSGSNDSLIYSPIVNYTAEEVWNTLMFNVMPRSIELDPLWRLYELTSGECPIIRDPRGTPCGKGRFGCWTCTVVRRDRAIQAITRDGHRELAPLLNFRNWLMEIRDRDEFRCGRRRNGTVGRGPFTLEGRKEILRKLLIAQSESGLPLISDEELAMITRLWTLDAKSPNYVER